MSDWKPVVVLPNIELQEPIEGGLAALVPAHDARVKALAKAHPDLRVFLSRFTDAFRRKIKPSILIVPQNVPEAILRTDALSSFRDVVALSVIPYNCALELRHPRGHRVLWADYFAIYPWMISKYDNRIIGNSPAIMGINDLKKFRGQSSPDLFQMTVNTTAIDEPLLTELLKRWREYYTTTDPVWSERALFRSLNMAFRAAEMPAGIEMTFYDVGRSIALWVSAFETLVHPGVGGDANLSKVYELLDKAAWDLNGSKAVSYQAFNGRTKARIPKSNGCWLYGEIYHARNDFLHGNPVELDRLKIDGSDRNLFEFAAPLYRMALTAFLSLAWPTPAPSMNDPEAFGQYIGDHMHFMDPQRTIEKGLLAANTKPKD